MNITKLQAFNSLFHLLSIATTVGCMCYCLHQYLLDEDVSLVHFVAFHKNKRNIYPSVSLCFDKPFLTEEFERHETGINSSAYADFLLGTDWNDKMKSINFNEVTKDPKDYFLGYCGLTNNWKRFYSSKITDMLDWACHHIDRENQLDHVESGIYGTTYGYQNYIWKCLAIDVPYIQNETVKNFQILMNTSILPVESTGRYAFCIIIHYPHQLLRSTDRRCEPMERKEQKIQFDIRTLQVVIQRNKPSQTCMEDVENDDDAIMTSMIQNLGCKPNYWNINSTASDCSNKSQMAYLNHQTPHHYATYPNPPCQRVRKALYEYVKANRNATDGVFVLKMRYEDETFMAIEQSRAYTIQSLVGNAGGYLGLFLGYAILQIPQFIALFYNWFNRNKV